MNTVEHVLAIDQGQKHFGICLAQYDGSHVRPLFIGTANLEPKPLENMVETRAARRRTRRTAREHTRRLKRLRDALTGRGGPLHDQQSLAQAVIAFCKRRGHFHGIDDEDEIAEEEIRHTISNKEFFVALESFLIELVPEQQTRNQVAGVCRSILSKPSRRKMRINAKKVGVCRWEGCKLRRTRAGLGSLFMAVTGKMRPFIEEKVISLDAVRNFCEQALAGTDTRSLLKILDQAIIDGLALGSGKPKKSPAQWIEALQGGEGAQWVNEDWKRRQTVKHLSRWAGKVKKVCIRDLVIKDIKAIQNPDRKARSSFCKDHQQAYVEYFLRGEIPPLKAESADVSRKVSIVSDKISSYLRKRVLPLLSDGQNVDVLSVESAGFDALKILDDKQSDNGGSTNKKKLPDEEELYELYWQGPRAEFGGDTREMLKAEFANTCVYCGKPLEGTFQIDHIFPRAIFPMRGYLSVVPAHAHCNKEKHKNSLFRRNLSVHSDALKAFEKYISKKKSKSKGAIHPIIDVKKGLLQNLTSEAIQERLNRFGGDLDRAERSLIEMAGNWMIRSTSTSRHSVHLRKALSAQLGIPKTTSIAPRHMAILRDALFGGWEYDKKESKLKGDKVENHALDAYTLAFGQATGFFSRICLLERFGRGYEDLLQETVAKMDPSFRNTQRFSVDFDPIVGFERITPNFNVVGGDKSQETGVSLKSISPPNRESSCFDTTLYAIVTDNGKEQPACRVSVATFLKKMKREYIERLTHLELRRRLLKAFDAGGKEAVKEALVVWYKETARHYAGCGAVHTQHPTIQQKWEDIRIFLEKEDAKAEDIPVDFSLRIIQKGRGGLTPLVRDSHTHQRVANGGTVAKVVGYRQSSNGPDRDHPIVISISADWAMSFDYRGGFRNVPHLPHELTEAFKHDKTPVEPRIRAKKKTLTQWLREQLNCVEWYWVLAGSTIERTDGSKVFVVNHKEDPPNGGYKQIASSNSHFARRTSRRVGEAIA